MIRTELKLGDCLELMPEIEDKSIDMILCDLPYGTTNIAWDKPIHFAPLWRQYERIIKDNGAIVLFSAQPFTTDLINSNRRLFRYEIIWRKTQPLGFLNAKKMPLRAHENILVFYKKLPTYNPQKTRLTQNEIKARLVNIGRVRVNGTGSQQYQEYRNPAWSYTETGERYPVDVIDFSNWNGGLFGNTKNATKHPTQKPVGLCKYLVLTFTNQGDVVLDNCMGAGTTGVACVNTGRNFIGIEINPKYYDLAKKRIKEAKQKPRLMEVE